MRRPIALLAVAAATSLALPQAASAAGWLPPIQLGTSPGTGHDLKAAIAPDGFVAAVDGRKVWTKRPGEAVTGPIDLTAATPTGSTSLAVGSGGAVSIADAQGTDVVVFRRIAGQTAFEAPLTLPSMKAGQRATVALLPDGQTIVASIGSDDRVKLTEISPAGVVLGPISLSSASENATELTLASGTGGHVVLAWGETEPLAGSNYNTRLYLSRRIAAGSYSAPADTDREVGRDATVEIIEFRPGKPFVAADGTAIVPYTYYDDNATDPDFINHYVVPLDPGENTAPFIFADSYSGSVGPGTGIEGAATIAPGGAFVATWAKRSSAGTDLRAARGTAATTTLTGSETEIGTVAGGYLAPVGIVNLGDGTLLYAAEGFDAPFTRSALAPPGGNFGALSRVFGTTQDAGSTGGSLLTTDGAGHAVTAKVQDRFPDPYSQELAIWDGGAPELRNLSVPTTATVGQTVTFAATPYDGFSTPSTPTWSFGDGTAAAAGASVTHAFAAPGTYTVTAATTDGAANTKSSTRTVTVSAVSVPPPPSGPIGDPQRDVTKPKLTGLKVPKRPRRSAAITASFSVDEQATVVVTLERVSKGRGRRGTPCKAKVKRGPRCTIYKQVRRVAPAALQGPGIVKIALRSVALKRLAAGSYRVTVVATDQAGNGSAPVRANLTVRR